MLVLVVIFTVVKFTIIYPVIDKSHQDTVEVVDQITVFLLLAALAALIWIFMIYFTSRKTRQQISSLLSCTGTGAASGGYSRRAMRAGYPPMAAVYGPDGAYASSAMVRNPVYGPAPGRNYNPNYV